MQQLLLLLLLLLLAASVGCSQLPQLNDSTTVAEFSRRLLHDGRYDRDTRDGEGGEEAATATVATAGLSVDSFGPVDAVGMDYGLEAVLQLRWYDSRLRFVDARRRRRRRPAMALVLSASVADVWKPGVYFPNAKTIQRHDVPSANLLLWLWPNGTLQYNQKLNVKFHCHMDLADFPFDTQSCRLLLSAFDMSSEDLQLRWSPLGVAFTDASSVLLNEFFPPQVELSASGLHSLATGANFSRLAATFRLRRRHLYYVITSYLPSALIVLITWSSFSIDYRSAPARVSLSIMSLLALLTESAAVERKLPPVSYVTRLGVWHFGCIVFIHLSLVEYMLINVLLAVERRRRRQLVETTTAADGGSQQRQPLCSNAKAPAAVSCWLRPAKLDFCLLLLYPIAFGAFNVVYWTVLVPTRR